MRILDNIVVGEKTGTQQSDSMDIWVMLFGRMGRVVISGNGQSFSGEAEAALLACGLEQIDP